MGLFYQLTKKETPFITFIHGLGEDHSIFNKQTAYLQELGYSTLAFDLRGHGRSGLKEKISIPSHAQDLETILQKENIQETNLVGFSLGAAVALEYAHKYPEKISKLCLINPAFYGKTFFTPLLKGTNVLLQLLKKLSKIDKKPRKKPVDLSKTPSSPAYFSLPYSLKNTSLTGLYANIQAMKEHGIPDYLPEIKTATLILVSEKDELIKKTLPDYIHQQLPNSELIVIPGNHLVLLKNQKEINKRLKKFFCS